MPDPIATASAALSPAAHSAMLKRRLESENPDAVNLWNAQAWNTYFQWSAPEQFAHGSSEEDVVSRLNQFMADQAAARGTIFSIVSAGVSLLVPVAGKVASAVTSGSSGNQTVGDKKPIGQFGRWWEHFGTKGK